MREGGRTPGCVGDVSAAAGDERGVRPETTAATETGAASGAAHRPAAAPVTVAAVVSGRTPRSSPAAADTSPTQPGVRPPKKKVSLAERLATTVMDAVEPIETLSFVVATLSASSLAVLAVWVFRKGRRNGYCGGLYKGLPKRDGWADRTGGIELNNLTKDENSPSARQRRRRHNAELDEIVVGRRQRIPEPTMAVLVRSSSTTPTMSRTIGCFGGKASSP